jgi:hypothetical protein
MPDLAAELWAVQHLAALCGMNVTNIRDAKTALGPVERGSFARAKEEVTARATQAPFGVWGVADYRPALALRLQEKCAVAARHDTRDVVAQTWLVVSACLNRWGAAASTMIVPGLVQTDELNWLFHGPLCGSRFERVYLVLHIGSVVFGWTRAEGWRIVADPDARERELHRARMNDLIFNQIPNNHLRSRMTG